MMTSKGRAAAKLILDLVQGVTQDRMYLSLGREILVDK